jgi:hypothetical protein
MALCSFVLRFREATFCGVPSRAFNKVGSVACKKFAENLSNYCYSAVWNLSSSLLISKTLKIEICVQDSNVTCSFVWV